MKMEDIRSDERPRERAIEHGMSTLGNRDLLAIILRSGYKGCNVLEVADHLLNQYGLRGLAKMSYEDLIGEKGIKDAKALELLACFELSKRLLYEEMKGKDIILNYDDLIRWLRNEIGNKEREHLVCIYLNAFNQVIHHTVLYQGTSDHMPVSAKDIYRDAMKYSADKIILAHNHPRGTLFPSREDIMSTELLMDAGETVGIPLVDHLIISNDGYFSIMKHLRDMETYTDHS